MAGVHRRGENDKIPRFLGHYWPVYDPELTASEPTPTTFCQYLMAGRKRSEQLGEAHHLVEKIAEGILRLVRLSHPTAELKYRKRKHLYVLELISDKSTVCADYRELVTYLAVDRTFLDSEGWTTKWSLAVIRIAEAISKAQCDAARTADFMQWQPQTDDGGGATSLPRDNFFRHPHKSPKVSLRVGSIHSVKGETHTATLVLDTYYVKHHLATLKPWLLGQKTGKGSEGVQNQARLKQHYVAMTRPTHLLCLAIREDAFSVAELDLLKNRSWRVARVRDDAHEWL